MIKFSCLTCAKEYRVADDKAGKRAKCAECGEPLVVPAPHLDSPPSALVARPKTEAQAEREAVASIRESEQQRPGNQLLWATPAVGVFVLGVFLMWRAYLYEPPLRQADVSTAPSVSQKPETEEERASGKVREWLDDQKNGKDVSWMWNTRASEQYGVSSYGDKIRLYSVRSYDILSVEVKPATEKTWQNDGLKKLAIVVVRVESSDSNGRPIVKTYRVRVGFEASSWPYLLGATG